MISKNFSLFLFHSKLQCSAIFPKDSNSLIYTKKVSVSYFFSQKCVFFVKLRSVEITQTSANNIRNCLANDGFTEQNSILVPSFLVNQSLCFFPSLTLKYQSVYNNQFITPHFISFDIQKILLGIFLSLVTQYKSYLSLKSESQSIEISSHQIKECLYQSLSNNL